MLRSHRFYDFDDKDLAEYFSDEEEESKLNDSPQKKKDRIGSFLSMGGGSDAEGEDVGAEEESHAPSPRFRSFKPGKAD